MASLSTSNLLALLALFFWQVPTSRANSPRSLHARDEFICPPDDIAATQCMGPKDCLYANPTSCTSFIHCEVNADGVSGLPTIQDCPDGLKWADDIKECDFPSSSTCALRG
jgi:hypothetical protein